MKMILDGKTYGVELEHNALAESVAAMCPMELTMSRSGDHEYYDTLPGKPVLTGTVETSQVKKDHLYLFAAWNALALVFRDTDISPYKVYPIGRIEDEPSVLLEKGGSRIRVALETEATE